MQEKRKTKKKIRWNNLFFLIILLSCCIITLISTLNILKWKLDAKKIDDNMEIINNNVTINIIPDSNEIKIIEPVEEIPKSNPYWDYIKYSLIDVDFTELKQINNNTVGWIQVKNTNVNYPFVQGVDNDFYLTHAFDNKYNKGGWVFMDYRNNKETFDKNTVLYAHGRSDKTMFGSLKNILTSNWINNPDNYVINVSTEYENSLWQIFSIYVIPTTNDYIQTKFLNDDDFLNLATTLLNRSQHNFNTTISATDKILTLSTCYNKEEKLVIHAKLIKIETKN